MHGTTKGTSSPAHKWTAVYEYAPEKLFMLRFNATDICCFVGCREDVTT